MAQSLAQEQILDHYKHPRNFGVLDSAQARAHVANPLCGDELDLFLSFDEHGAVSQAMFTGRGCTISIASASLLTEKLKGLSHEAVEALTTDDILQLLEVKVNPARLKCATLSLEDVQQALHAHART